MAADRSDAMLSAFQDACFPQLKDLEAQRAKLIESGFTSVPSDSIPELRQLHNLAQGAKEFLPMFETYRGQRDGVELVVDLLVRITSGTKQHSCGVYDFAAPEPVNDRKLADWLGRPADYPPRGPGHISKWLSINGLPEGYAEIFSIFAADRGARRWRGARLVARTKDGA